MVTGSHPSEVIELIRARIRGGKNVLKDRRLALVVEGGAMRGTYTAGSLLGLHLLGADQIFDSLYATSAGAINAAHFLSGVGHLQAGTYYKALADGRFYSRYRFPRPVDVDFVFDVVLRKEMPLRMDLTSQSETAFKVALLHRHEGSAELKTIQGSDQLAWDTLKAAIAMPVVYNKSVLLPGGHYVDGGMAIPYPLREAIRDGATDIVLCLSRNPTLPKTPRGLHQYLLWSTVFARWNPRLVKVFEDWLPTVRILDAMATGTAAESSPCRLLTIFPSKTKVFSATQDKEILRAGCIEMAEEVLNLFDAPLDPLKDLVRKGVV